MAPPGVKAKKKPSVTIAVGVGKPAGGGKMPPPGMEEDDAPDDAMPDEGGGEGGQKHSVAEAHKVGANEHCKDCVHYQANSGDCEEVDGYWEPEDACVKYFEAGASDEPDADEQGGPPDMDADDQNAQ